ncbi:MAG: phosphotriesterase family protein [Bacteroidales bacterium]
MKHLFFATWLAGLTLLISSCSKDTDRIIMTVTGPIKPSQMGKTLVHEHVLVDFIGADSTDYHRWNRQEVEERVAPFMEEIKELGVRTLVECTPAYVGRDPWLLRSLSEETGMQLVTNTGYYGASGNRYLPVHAEEMGAMELSRLWIDEYRNGIEDSGVKPGFIKIAVAPDDTLSALHEKIVSAAAMTHNQTGLVIASHTGPDAPAFAQIRILKTFGIDPSHFIWVHAQRGTLDGNLKAASMGAWISLDNVNDEQFPDPEETYSTGWYANRIMALKEAGYLNRVMISHDAGWFSPGEENGGEFRGYTDIFTRLIPELEERGFTRQEVNQLLVANPRRAFSFQPL